MSRQVLLGCWAAIALGFLASEAAAVLGGGRVGGLLDFMGRLTRRDPALLAVFVGWMWMGWHFFAR